MAALCAGGGAESGNTTASAGQMVSQGLGQSARFVREMRQTYVASTCVTVTYSTREHGSENGRQTKKKYHAKGTRVAVGVGAVRGDVFVVWGR